MRSWSISELGLLLFSTPSFTPSRVDSRGAIGRAATRLTPSGLRTDTTLMRAPFVRPPSCAAVAALAASLPRPDDGRTFSVRSPGAAAPSGTASYPEPAATRDFNTDAAFE